MPTTRIAIPLSAPRDPYITDRAMTYLNFALHLRIAPDAAIDYATDALDDDSNQLDINDAPDPLTRESDDLYIRRALLLALANESFHSDDDFDDFLHELDHANNRCTDPDYCSDNY